MMILLAGFVMPVAAAGPATITTSSDNYVIGPLNQSTVSFMVTDANNTTEGNEYTLNVSLNYNKLDSSDPLTKTGFTIADYVGKGSIPKDRPYIKNATLSGTATAGFNLKYGLDCPPQDKFAVDVVINATALVYDGETATLKAELFQNNTKIAEKTVTITAEFPRDPNNPSKSLMTSRSMILLSKPLILPANVSANRTVIADHRFYSDKVFHDLKSRVHYDYFNIDFSNVVIKSGGETKTYNEWLVDCTSNGSTPPIVFKDKDGGELTNNILSLPGINSEDLSWNKSDSFSIIVTDTFVYDSSNNPPYIDFSNLAVDASVYIFDSAGSAQNSGRRGPSVTMSTDLTQTPLYPVSASKYLNGSVMPTKITGNKSLFTTITYIDAVGNSSYHPYLLKDSVQYVNPTDINHHLYYQELFKLGSEGTVDEENVTINISVPEGVTITHIRLPLINDTNPDTVYESITVSTMDGSNTLTFTPTSSPEANRVMNLTGWDFSTDNDVCLSIQELLKMKKDDSGGNSYNKLNLIQFVGTTDNLAGPAVFGFEITGENTETTTTFSKSIPVTDTFIPNPYVNTETALSSKIVSRSESFNISLKFFPTSYPYYSGLREDPTDPLNTALYPCPYAYFTIPKDFSVSTATFLYSHNGKDNTLIPVSGYEAQVLSPITVGDKKIIPVKIVNETDPTQEFWLKGNGSAGKFYITLTVQVPSNYNGIKEFTFKPTDYVLTTWASGAYDSMSGGSAGSNVALDTLSISSPMKPHGSYDQTGRSETLTVSVPKGVQADVTTRIIDAFNNIFYKSYNPKNAGTIPQLRAGSTHEEFKIFVSNDGEKNFTNSVVYFVLPKEEHWGAKINGQLTQIPPATTSGTTYDVYYTTTAVRENTELTAAHEIKDVNDAAISSWTLLTFDGTNKATITNPESVTAIKIVFSKLTPASNLTMLLPFGLPSVDNTLVNYGDESIGQTLHYFEEEGSGATTKNDKGYTGAIKLVKSRAPTIVNAEATKPFSDTAVYNVDYGAPATSIPNWWTALTYDDFSSGIGISTVQVVFTPADGTSSIPTSLTNKWGTPTEYDPQLTDADYKNGTTTTINEADRTCVNTSKPGQYVITYTTSNDDDNQKSTGVMKINITKAASTITLQNEAAEIFWKEEIPSGYTSWKDYFQTLLTGGTDSGNPIPTTSYAYDVSSAFINETPGNYSLKYNYTDSALNTKTALVNVTVKYNGTLTGKVSGNGGNVMGAELSITPVGSGTGSATTLSSGVYTYSLNATATAPTSVDYTATLTSVPAGLILPTASADLTKTGTANATVGLTPNAATFSLDPVTFNVTGLDSTWMESVSLYKSGATPTLVEAKTVTSGTTFLVFSPADLNWFESGDYYLTVTVKSGSQPTGDFTTKVNTASSLNWKTSDITMGNVNITKSVGTRTDAPSISGYVWNDADHNSTKEGSESGISGVTVNLLNDTDGLLTSATTNDIGFYQFFDPLAVGSGYRIQVDTPTGFNKVSAFTGGQKINESNGSKSDLISISSTIVQHTGINAGFYYENPIVLQDEETELFWKESIPTGYTTWSAYFQSKLTRGMNGTVTIPETSSYYTFNLTGSDTFNVNTPGNYTLKYDYDDGVNTKQTANVMVVVKYNGTLTGSVTGNGGAVENAEISVTPQGSGTGLATTTVGGTYNYLLEATKSAPTSVDYTAILDSTTIPIGLIIPETTDLEKAGTVSKTDESKLNAGTFALDPVTFNVTDLDFTWMDSVSLYKSGATPTLVETKSVTSGTTFLVFEPAANTWFESGDYYLTVQVKAGSQPNGGDFTSKVSPAVATEWKTADISMGHADIEKAVGAQSDAPFISGHVWNDKDQDSIRDDDEVPLSDVLVKLFNSDNDEIDSATTDSDGYYSFYNRVDAGTNYYVQINLPDGFNHASDFVEQQKINKDNDYKSDLILIEAVTGGLKHEGINAGFYYAQDNPGSGGPVGNATVVPMSEPMKGNNTPEDNKTPEVVVVPFDENPPVNPESFSMLGLIFVLLSVLLALPQLLRIYKIKSEKQEKSVTFHILAIVLAVIVLILFFLFYSLSGEMNYYSTTDLVLAAAFIVEALITVKAYGKI
ncbi:SdrD B-like domain-containing protein [Methanolapillus ohkumae]